MSFPNPRRTILMAAMGASTALLGCGPSSGPVIHGAGPVVQEQRAFRPIHEVVVEGKVNLLVRVLPAEPGSLPESSGPETAVFLEGAQDLLEWVQTSLDGKRLTIDIRENARLDPLPTIEIQLGRLEAMKVVGSGDIEIEGFHGGAFDLGVTGSADVRASGTADAVDVSHVGSGDIDLRDLICDSAAYSGVGSGDVRLNASEVMTSTVKGSGEVFVHGTVSDDRITSSSIGSSKVTRVRPSSEDAPQ